MGVGREELVPQARNLTCGGDRMAGHICSYGHKFGHVLPHMAMAMSLATFYRASPWPWPRPWPRFTEAQLRMDYTLWEFLIFSKNNDWTVFRAKKQFSVKTGARKKI